MPPALANDRKKGKRGNIMASEKLVITNIGQILSGKLEAPILDGDCVVSVDGRIIDIG